jgi:hypothetical protein
MAHRDGNLPVAALEALHARKRRALEIILKRSRYGIRLLRRQKSKMKLLLVVDEVTRPVSGRFGYSRTLFHGAYYTKFITSS